MTDVLFRIEELIAACERLEAWYRLKAVTSPDIGLTAEAARFRRIARLLRLLQESGPALCAGFMSCNARQDLPDHWHWDGDLGNFRASVAAMLDAALTEMEDT